MQPVEGSKGLIALVLNSEGEGEEGLNNNEDQGQGEFY